MGKNRIYSLRRQKKIPQALLGDLLGVSQQTVSKIESQPIPDISSELLCRIADYFGVTADYLMERSEQSCDFNFADMDPREIGECLTPADKKMWLEMGIRLAGNEFMAKHKKKSGEIMPDGGQGVWAMCRYTSTVLCRCQ